MTKQIIIVPDCRETKTIQSEKDSQFLCPLNTVLTGRCHSGDENGPTTYEYATLKALDSSGAIVSGAITVVDVKWSDEFKESDNITFSAPLGHVIVGRKHSGDENGLTSYAYAVVKFNNEPAIPNEAVFSDQIKESSNIWFRTDSQRIITGRCHSGDENGNTFYISAILQVLQLSYERPPQNTSIVIDERKLSPLMPQKGSAFVCPTNTILTGRFHSGDENGNTQYEYATLKAIDSNGNEVLGNITVDYLQWSTEIKENSGSGFDSAKNRVIVGIKHSGDENGTTSYATAIIRFNSYSTQLNEYKAHQPFKENEGIWFKTTNDRAITGRQHYGDENGNTFYSTAKISCDKIDVSSDIRVNLLFHPEEEYFPMNPIDFITLSRLRMDTPGGSDYGYDKSKNSFVLSNSHSPNFYNIPLSIVNSLKVNPPYELMNLRPLDGNSFGDEKYFLEPDDNLTGNKNPNGIIPVFTHSTFYIDETTNEKCERREFWIFYGYNYAKWAISFSHQGDWERIIIDLDSDKKIKGAWLSQHEDLMYYTKEQLSNVGALNGNTLRIYSAKGSHANYISAGEFTTKWPDYDETRDNGYCWIITTTTEPLDMQPWKDFAGAWGEVGFKTYTTGPLGPWYKRWDKSTQVDDTTNLSDLIDDNSILIVPDVRHESRVIVESSGDAFEAPQNMLITGRYHSGDENGNTQYEYASLKGIDINGNIVKGVITIGDLRWERPIKEVGGSCFRAPKNRVITGRVHSGDENGETMYQTGIVYFDGKATTVNDAPITIIAVKESMGHFFKTDAKYVLIEQQHSGDENGITAYKSAYLTLSK